MKNNYWGKIFRSWGFLFCCAVIGIAQDVHAGFCDSNPRYRQLGETLSLAMRTSNRYDAEQCLNRMLRLLEEASRQPEHEQECMAELAGLLAWADENGLGNNLGATPVATTRSSSVALVATPPLSYHPSPSYSAPTVPPTSSFVAFGRQQEVTASFPWRAADNGHSSVTAQATAASSIEDFDRSQNGLFLLTRSRFGDLMQASDFPAAHGMVKVLRDMLRREIAKTDSPFKKVCQDELSLLENFVSSHEYLQAIEREEKMIARKTDFIPQTVRSVRDTVGGVPGVLQTISTPMQLSNACNTLSATAGQVGSMVGSPYPQQVQSGLERMRDSINRLTPDQQLLVAAGLESAQRLMPASASVPGSSAVHRAVETGTSAWGSLTPMQRLVVNAAAYNAFAGGQQDAQQTTGQAQHYQQQPNGYYDMAQRR